jgi:hypothetical protein
MLFKDVKDLVGTVSMTVRLCGASAEFNREYAQRLDPMLAAVREEANITSMADVDHVSPEMEFTSEEAVSRYRDLCHWLSGQHPSFADLATK